MFYIPKLYNNMMQKSFTGSTFVPGPPKTASLLNN